MKLACRFFLAVGLLALNSAVSVSAATFSIWISGPRSVIQGDLCTLVAGGDLTSGKLKDLRATLTGLPPNTTLEYIWNTTRYPTAPNITLGDSYGMHIVTSKTTPLGTYPLTLTYTATDTYNVVTKQTKTINFTVRPMPATIMKLAFPPDVPLPAITKWEQNMITYGKKYSDAAYMGCCTDDQAVWYYDGARVYLQMADYTGKPEFLAFGRKIHEAYRNYLLSTTAGTLYRRFPHGLAMWYDRERPPDALKALGKLQDFANPGDRLHWGSSWQIARDMAYSVSSHVIAEREGFPRSPLFQDHLALLMGIFEQWFISKTAEFTYPFLVGLAAEALIDYYEDSKDPRVPYLLKLAGDWCYENEWDPVSESFWLIEKQNGVIKRYAAPDLNLMMAPLYGWLFQQTGDVKYRDIGDKVFTSGVNKAWLGGGKQFSQNYRWSFKYVEWRKSPVAPTAPAVPSPVQGLQVSVDSQ